MEVRLKGQELNALPAPLERYGAVISGSLQGTTGAGHLHSSELIRWDQAHPSPRADASAAPVTEAILPDAVCDSMVASGAQQGVVDVDGDVLTMSPGMLGL
jgi:hypothetical protein